MTTFIVILLVALLLVIGLWNRVGDFKTAYLQTLQAQCFDQTV